MSSNTIHHSDAGSQYTSVRCGETQKLSGLMPSIGSGTPTPMSLAETTIGLFNACAVQHDSPFRTGPLRHVGDVEHLTAVWVGWFNVSRLMHRLGRIPPIEAEQNYYTQRAATSVEAHQ